MINMILHNCTCGPSDTLYHFRHYSRHRHYECDSGI